MPKPIKTKLKPKWGVSVFRDAVIGPVLFRLLNEKEDGYPEDEIDPLNLSHWTYDRIDYDLYPTRLFQNRKNATLFAEGARAARSALIEVWGEDLTEKHDFQAEE